MEKWLSMLALMSTYGKYFKASEIKEILQRWGQMRAKWLPLIAAVRLHKLHLRKLARAAELRPQE